MDMCGDLGDQSFHESMIINSGIIEKLSTLQQMDLGMFLLKRRENRIDLWSGHNSKQRRHQDKTLDLRGMLALC